MYTIYNYPLYITSYLRQKEKRVTEDEMVGWHHQFLNMNLGKLWETVRDREAWCAPVPGVMKSRP